MLKYILKRIFISIFVLLGVSIILYTLVRMMPSDYIDLKYAQQIAENKITQEQVDYFKSLYGIGDKSFSGLVNGYFKWLGNLLQGNLGRSFKYEMPVADVISQNMWISFAIAVIGEFYLARRLFNNGFIALVGGIAYELYLVHFRLLGLPQKGVWGMCIFLGVSIVGAWSVNKISNYIKKRIC